MNLKNLFLLISMLFTGLLSSNAANDKITAEQAEQADNLLLGVKGGRALQNKEQIIDELNMDKGVPLLEVLFSESLLGVKSPVPGNPLGHIGMAINGKAYSVSEGYWKKTKKIFVNLSLADYLYATKNKEISKHVFASSIGSCYGRAVWGIRVFKLPAKYSLKKMATYWENANKASLKEDPEFAYKFTKQNCASFVAWSLRAGGFADYTKGRHLIHYPRDIAIDFLKEITADQNSNEFEFEVVLYNQVPLPKANRKYGTSLSVPNIRWTRLIKSLPVLRKFGKKLPTFKGNTMREIAFDAQDENNPLAVIQKYKRKSWLKKLRNRISKEKWNKGK